MIGKLVKIVKCADGYRDDGVINKVGKVIGIRNTQTGAFSIEYPDGKSYFASPRLGDVYEFVDLEIFKELGD